MKFLLHLAFLLLSGFALAQNPCDKGDDTPPCPKNPGCQLPDCNCKEDGQKDSIPVIGSMDPNLIIGPAGYDTTLKWVSVQATLPYKVLFENHPDSATAPARKVIIYVPLHSHINPVSLRLGDFGFGSFVFPVPENTTIFSKRLDVRDSLGVFVDITAGLDIANRRAFWIFESIDPATGLANTLPPNSGFLPINDSITHRGEGFVTFTVRSVTTAQTRDTLAEKASIIFDDNEAIETNVEKNTIDAKAPESRINLVTLVQDTIHLHWTGTDDAQGSGVKDYSLYVSVNGGPFILFKKDLAALETTYFAIPGNTYCFFTRARDNTGNTEPMKNFCEGRVGGPALPLTWLYFNGIRKDEFVDLNWSTLNESNTDKYFVERSVNGSDFTGIGSRPAAGNSTTVLEYNFKDYEGVRLPAPMLYYRIRQTDRDGRFTYSNTVAIRNNQPSAMFVKVYPNPFSNSITVEIRSSLTPAAEDRLELYNNKGERVYTRSLFNMVSNGTVTITNLQNLSAGIYYLNISIKGEKEVVKIVKY